MKKALFALASLITSVSMGDPGPLPTLGPDNAPVTIEAAVDLECPFSADYLIETLPKLLARYPGKMRVQIHQAPMEFHRIAARAAQAAVCAQEQGYYWEFQKAILEAQWGKFIDGKRSSRSAKKELTPAQVDAVANGLVKFGLSQAKLESCLALSETRQKVAKQKSEMEARGLTGVPYSIVGDAKVSGNNFGQLEAALSKVLGP